MIFYSIRFSKFIKVKDFLFDNEDIYDNDDESYFPNSYFNIDSFPLAISINIFIFEIIYTIFPNKKSLFNNPIDINKICCIELKKESKGELKYSILLIIPLFSSFAIFEIS